MDEKTNVNQQNDPATGENKGKETQLTPEQKKEMCDFCYIDTFNEQDTIFMNAAAEFGRTCIILGTLGMHIRSKGKREGEFWDEKINAKNYREESWDVSASIKRNEITGIAIIRMEVKKEELSEEEQAKASRFVWDVNIACNTGGPRVAVFGLKKADAVMYKKIIWGWITAPRPAQMFMLPHNVMPLMPLSQNEQNNRDNPTG